MADLELRLETSLKQLLNAERAAQLGNVQTAWDDSLAFILMPALALFEQDASLGAILIAFDAEGLSSSPAEHRTRHEAIHNACNPI